MPLHRKLLAPGEEVVLETHPNWSILAPRVAMFLVIVAGCLSVVVAWARAPLWVGWVLLGVAALFLLGLLAKIVVWRSTTLVLTTLRIVYRRGALRRLGREIPLDRVQDVTYSQSILERLVGAGSLTIESAGSHGDEPFPDIRHPELVQSLINRLIAQPGGGLGGSGARAGYAPQPQYAPPQPQHRAATAAAVRAGIRPGARARSFGAAEMPAASSSEQMQRLSELHRLGVLTDAEYARSVRS